MFASVWKLMKENIFEVDNEINNDLICGICKRLMIKACNVPCGCHFCSDCIEHYLEVNYEFCPGTAKYCQVQKINFIRDVSVDHSANFKISEITVKCPRTSCQYKDQLCKIQNHIGTCDKRPISCPFNAIGCDMNEVMNHEMKDHLNENNFCHSKLLIEFINNLRNEMNSMKNEMIELKREHKQKFDIMELKYKNQQQKLCETEKKEMENSKEIDMLNQEMVALKNENRTLRDEMNTNVKSMKEIKQYIELTEAKSIQKIELINKEMTDVKNENQSIKIQMETDAKSMQEIRQQIEEDGTRSQQQINELKQNYQQQEENTKVEMEKCANEIRLIQTKFEYENFMKFGFFNGRIEKLSQKRGEWISSKPFYSSLSGYKMCLKVIISNNGDISVLFHLMRGEFDDKLDWPFKYAVTVDVINPADGNVCQSKTRKYSDCPERMKPSNDLNNPIYIHGSFCNNFILNNSAAIKNDLLLLKCKIDRL